jgi:glyoxylase-like metal-dependent hydrolase (beta-lactamase superfamily II)
MPGTNQAPVPPKIMNIQYLSDGQTLDFNGDKIEAFALPGHTYDSSAYLVFGILFMGDSASGQYNGRIGSAPPFVSVDRNLNQRELKKLAVRLQYRKSDIEYLAFGHQGPIKGLDPLLLWASSH